MASSESLFFSSFVPNQVDNNDKLFSNVRLLSTIGWMRCCDSKGFCLQRSQWPSHHQSFNGECQCFQEKNLSTSSLSLIKSCSPSLSSSNEQTCLSRSCLNNISNISDYRHFNRALTDCLHIPTEKSAMKTIQFSSLHSFLILMILTLALNHFSTCDTQTISWSPYYGTSLYHHRYPRITPEEFPDKSKLNNRSLTLYQASQINRIVRQPQINFSRMFKSFLKFDQLIIMYCFVEFCGPSPVVANANSHLQRNQKHFVYEVGQTATYMCNQGYKPVSGVSETHCTPAIQINTQPVNSHVISGRSKNSKRLNRDLDEETELNANGHKSEQFPGNYADKRKMSRKTDDDLIRSVYDASSITLIDGRNSDLENDSVEYHKKLKMAPRWWPPITLNCQRMYHVEIFNYSIFIF